MENPVTMFMEKDDASGKRHWSMTRVTVVLFTIAYVFRVFRFSLMGVAFGNADAFVIFTILFALPFSKMFAGAAGAGLLGKLLDKFGTGAPGVNATTETVSAVLERHVEPAADNPPKGD